MIRYTVRRLLWMVVVLLGVSLIVFSLIFLSPGDPIRLMLGEDPDPDTIERLRQHYGLDEPFHVQYFLWLGNALQGDLGRSIRQRAPVADLVLSRIGATIELAAASVLLAMVIGIPLGVLAAVRRGGWLDSGSMALSLVGVSMPNFWLGLVLLSYVALNVAWVPVFGRGPAFTQAVTALFTAGDPGPLWDSVRHLLLPATALGTAIAGLVTRLTRSSLLEVLAHDYVRTARAKGLREGRVVNRHALRNALLPVITVVGLQFGFLLGGAITTEVVFAWPGAGRLIVDAIRQRDFPIVQGGVLLVAASFVLINLLVDLSYAMLDPRIRYD